MWYKNRVAIPTGAAVPNEVVFEVISGSDRVGCGLAVADIRSSGKHYHKKTVETYTLVSGELRVYVGDKVEVLRTPGQTVTIAVNTPHRAESVGENAARIAVFTLPAWTPEDHLLV